MHMLERIVLSNGVEMLMQQRMLDRVCGIRRAVAPLNPVALPIIVVGMDKGIMLLSCLS